VPEGLTSQQIVDRMMADENLSGEVLNIPAEGAILPETYGIERGMPRQELLDIMVAKRAQVLQAAWDKRQSDLPYKTAEEALALASVVEKETGRADERDRIAGVFVNRLRKGMRLQSDPTILYGLYGGAVQWGKPILQSEIDAKNAHNTYQIKGIPPTPICNPGKAAIEAVLSPAQTSDLYFVADGTGGHTFSDTLKEHNQAATEWRKVEKTIRSKEATTKADVAKPVAAKAAGADAIPNPPTVAPAAAAPVAAPVKTINAAPAAAAAAAVPSPVKTLNAAPAAAAAAVPPPVKKPKE